MRILVDRLADDEGKFVRVLAGSGDTDGAGPVVVQVGELEIINEKTPLFFFERNFFCTLKVRACRWIALRPELSARTV